MNKKELIEVGCVIIILIALFSLLIFILNKQYEEDAIYCEERGMKMEKTRLSRFCVDDKGQVYWIKK